MHVGLKPREQRIRVRAPCRFNHDGQWSDGCVLNMSSRGMLLQSSDVPAKGGYVDIRRGSLVIVARVMWRAGSSFGVHTQERVELSHLLGNQPSGAAPKSAVVESAAIERRAFDRAITRRRIGEETHRSRHRAARWQFAAVMAIVVLGAGLAAFQVYDVLGASSGTIASVLADGIK